MKNLTHKPRIFVGASSEAEDIDRQVTRVVESLGAEVIGWRDVFKPGDFPLDVLVRLPSTIDGALLIATPDDTKVTKKTTAKKKSQGKKTPSKAASRTSKRRKKTNDDST